jgi:O-methyltransferase
MGLLRLPSRLRSLFRPRRPDLLDDVAPFTLCDRQRLRSLELLCEAVDLAGVPGDLVECGTYRGGSAAVISARQNERHLWIYDSFRGLPETTARDGEHARQWVGALKARPADVHEVMRIVGTPQTKYSICEGFFDTTFSQPGPSNVALLHCDADWYESVTQVLEKFYPLMPDGACVVLDDFGYWEGCREAFYDFCERHRERPLLERTGFTQAYWFKSRAHNRS